MAGKNIRIQMRMALNSNKIIQAESIGMIMRMVYHDDALKMKRGRHRDR